MATEVKNQPEVNVSQTTDVRVVRSAEQFWSKNSKFFVYGVVAVVVLIGGWFAYKKYVKAPAEQEAYEAIWTAQSNFKIDSFALALNGNKTKANPGFLKVAKDHSSTKAGNLAKFYAGSCYLHLGDFNNAIKYLDDFSTSEAQLKLRKEGSLGDAYAELGKFDQAITHYKNATTAFEEDEVNSSEYLFRLGQLYDKTGKPKEAIEAFKTLRSKYPAASRSPEAQKYLAKLGDLE